MKELKEQSSNNKKRLFYLDFIRAFATIIIVITHFNALFLYEVYRPELAVGSAYVFNIYIGSFGVSLFLIISGASLMYVYQDKLGKSMSIKEYFIKRIKKLYPMFWIAYFITMCIGIIQYGEIFINRSNAPKFNFIYSILGLDGYLTSFGIRTFYIVGEWFLGFIIIFYLIFPILLKLVKKFPKITLLSLIIIYAISLIYIKNDYMLPVRIIEIVFGMYLIYYNKDVKWYFALISLIFLIINQLFNLPIDYNLKVTTIGISAFTFLIYVSNYLQHSNIIQKICSIICKYSYACFIIHHWVIYQVIAKTNLSLIGKAQSYMIFISCCVAIIIASYILQAITDKLTSTTKDIMKKEIKEE